MEILMEYLGRGFVTMLSIALPCVLTAAAIGLVVGILQAVTQVQEQTIAAAPKILFVFIVVMLLGSTNATLMMNYFTEGTTLAFNVVSKNKNYVLPANYYYHTRPFTEEMYDRELKRGNVNEIMKNPGKIPWAEPLDKGKFGPANRGSNPSPNFIERNKMMGR
ncbi:flagellar biosynthetic protein FliQ [Candidatus Gastranaerophilus sp. (ex Termes propinquus)]|nr:flagellar biosynthetic protein FliQ [Candidatus Gastranaerophilus sp. (ex Termes propinquus)]